MAHAGFPCELPSKAMVFVKCEQYEDVNKALIGRELHPFHIVITESFEYLLEQILQGFPSRKRPCVKRNTRVRVYETHENAEASEDDDKEKKNTRDNTGTSED